MELAHASALTFTESAPAAEFEEANMVQSPASKRPNLGYSTERSGSEETLMKAIVVTDLGGEEVLQVKEVLVPNLKDDEVLIKVVAIAVNVPDINERRLVGVPKSFGLECSGIVEKVGKQVKMWKIHDEVCAILSGEGYAEKVCVPEGHVLPKPCNVDLVSAASLPYASCTIWAELFTKSRLSYTYWLPKGKARLSSGETLLVHEDCSGIHIFAIQLAKRMGATVYVTTREENNRYKSDFHADVVLDLNDHKNLIRPSVNEGVDVILSSLGQCHFHKNLSCLNSNGRLISLGDCSLDTRDGFNTFPDTTDDIPKLFWLCAVSFWRRDDNSKATIVGEVKKELWPLIESGDVRSVYPCRVFPFSEANEAHKLMKSDMQSHNYLGGKILLVPNSVS